MSDNEYSQYSYNPYQQPNDSPIAGNQRAFEAHQPLGGYKSKRSRNRFFRNLANNPLIATVSLLAIGVGFASLIVSGLTNTPTAIEDLPVIKAETTAFKEAPKDAGGTEIPNEDSTIFAVMRDDAFKADGSNNVKNLLAPDEPVEEPIEDKLASFSEKAEALIADASKAEKEIAKQEAEAESIAVLAAALPQSKTESAQEQEAKLISRATALNNLTPASGTPSKGLTPDAPAKKPAAPSASEDAMRKADGKRPDNLHAAGSSPETLAFVRSVLDSKGSDEPTNTILDKVEPASGSASTKTASASQISSSAAAPSGSYYVQLGSVSSADGAEKEWSKLSSALNLQGKPHRVSKADLGARGIYYRIQAGPFAQAYANTLCDNIKAQKPGGCLVVK